MLWDGDRRKARFRWYTEGGWLVERKGGTPFPSPSLGNGKPGPGPPREPSRFDSRWVLDYLTGADAQDIWAYQMNIGAMGIADWVKPCAPSLGGGRNGLGHSYDYLPDLLRAPCHRHSACRARNAYIVCAVSEPSLHISLSFFWQSGCSHLGGIRPSARHPFRFAGSVDTHRYVACTKKNTLVVISHETDPIHPIQSAVQPPFPPLVQLRPTLHGL